MVKWKQYDIYLLLASLFVFSCGLGLLHVGKKDKQAAAIKTLVDAQTDGAIEKKSEYADDSISFILTLNNEELIKYLRPFLASRSVEKIVSELKGISSERILPIVRLLITHANIPLLLLDKKELLLEVAALYSKQEEQEAILKLLLENKELQKGRSLLAVAAELEMFEKTIPVLINWYNKVKNNKDASDFIRTLIMDAYTYAIDEDKVNLFARLQKFVPLQKNEATELLWRVVQKNRSSEFIPLIKAAQADFDAIKNQKTPLIEAVLNQNYALVESILKAGAKVNLVPHDETGSALQNVLRKTTVFEQEKNDEKIKNNIQIEELLRHYGARE